MSLCVSQYCLNCYMLGKWQERCQGSLAKQIGVAKGAHSEPLHHLLLLLL